MGRQLSSRVDQCVLKWFGHVERMDEEHMAKKVMLKGIGIGVEQGWDRLMV